MTMHLLVLAAGLAFAGEPAKKPVPQAIPRPPEETLRVLLSGLRGRRAQETREAIIGAADDLRDSVAAGEGSTKARLADRLPGMARDPFGICRDLAGCKAAPQSLHVEDDALIDDAFMALARPWFKLQEARGKAVKVAIDPGVGVRLTLEDFPGRAAVILAAAPTPTGGFDLVVDDGPAAAKDFAAERAAVLRSLPNR